MPSLDVQQRMTQLLSSFNAKTLPEGGLLHANQLYALPLTDKPESLVHLDRFLVQLRHQGVSAETAIKRQDGLNLLAMLAGYLLQIVSRRTNYKVEWFDRETVRQRIPADAVIPDAFFSSIIGIINGNICLPLGVLTDILNGKDRMSCHEFVAERISVVGEKHDQNDWCRIYLDNLRRKAFIPGGNAYRAATEIITFDDSFRSVQEIDLLLKTIREQESLDTSSYGVFMADREKQNFLLIIAYYLGMLVAKHASTSIKWYSFEEFKALIQQPERPYQAELHTIFLLGELFCYPLRVLVEILFDPAPTYPSCLEYVQSLIRNFPQPQFLVFPPVIGSDFKSSASGRMLDAFKDAGVLASTTLYQAEGGHDFQPHQLIRKAECKPLIKVCWDFNPDPSAHEPDDMYVCTSTDIKTNLPYGRFDAASLEIRGYGEESFSFSLIIPYLKKTKDRAFSIFPVFMLRPEGFSTPTSSVIACMRAFYESASAFKVPETGSGLWEQCYTDMPMPSLDTSTSDEQTLAGLASRFKDFVSQRSRTQADQIFEVAKKQLAQLSQIQPPECIKHLDSSLRRYLQVIPPVWLKSDPLYRQIQAMPQLYRQGKVVWAAIVQSNNLMFEPGGDSCPAEIVFDPTGTTVIGTLKGAAKELYRLKNTTPDVPDRIEYAAHLTNEMTRIFNADFPESIAPLPLKMSTIWLWRGHFPDGVLTLTHFPVIISDACPGVAMVLPSLFWPADFKAEWMQTSSERHGSGLSDFESVVFKNARSPDSLFPQHLLEPALADIFEDEPPLAFVNAQQQQAEELYQNGMQLLNTPQRDVVSAVRSFKEAAEMGNANAKRQLAYMYGEGIHVNRDDKLSLHYMLQLAQDGHAAACVAVAGFYLEGRGCQIKIPEARRWLQKAVKLGHTEASGMLVKLDQFQQQEASLNPPVPEEAGSSRSWVDWLMIVWVGGGILIVMLIKIFGGPSR